MRIYENIAADKKFYILDFHGEILFSAKYQKIKSSFYTVYFSYIHYDEVINTHNFVGVFEKRKNIMTALHYFVHKSFNAILLLLRI